MKNNIFKSFMYRYYLNILYHILIKMSTQILFNCLNIQKKENLPIFLLYIKNYIILV